MAYNQAMNKGFAQILFAIIIALGIVATGGFYLFATTPHPVTEQVENSPTPSTEIIVATSTPAEPSPSISPTPQIKKASPTPLAIVKKAAPTPTKVAPQIINCGTFEEGEFISEMGKLEFNDSGTELISLAESNKALVCLGKSMSSCTPSKISLGTREFGPYKGNQFIVISGTKANCTISLDNTNLPFAYENFRSNKYICPINEFVAKIKFPAFATNPGYSPQKFPGYYALMSITDIFGELNDGPDTDHEGLHSLNNTNGVCKADYTVNLSQMADCGNFDFNDPSLNLTQGDPLSTNILTATEKNKALVCFGKATIQCPPTKMRVDENTSFSITGGESSCTLSLNEKDQSKVRCPLQKLLPHTPFFALSETSGLMFGMGDFEKYPGYSMLMILSFLPANLKESSACK